MISAAFAEWCRDNLARGRRPTADDALAFFLDVSAGHKIASDGWAEVQQSLTRCGLIE